jgi:hypothetical protein
MNIPLSRQIPDDKRRGRPGLDHDHVSVVHKLHRGVGDGVLMLGKYTLPFQNVPVQGRRRASWIRFIQSFSSSSFRSPRVVTSEYPSTFARFVTDTAPFREFVDDHPFLGIKFQGHLCKYFEILSIYL